MRNKLITTTLLAGLTLLLSSCAGYRSGIGSLPYFEQNPKLAIENIEGKPDFTTLSTAELDIRILLNNTLQTSDTQVMLFAVPTSIDLSSRYLGNQSSGAMLYLGITPKTKPVYFQPEKMVLTISGVPHAATKSALGFSVDPDNKNLTEKIEIEELPTQGRRYELNVMNRYYFFRIQFGIPTPSPKQDISLEVRDAIKETKSDTPLSIPKIRFQKIFWKSGYT